MAPTAERRHPAPIESGGKGAYALAGIAALILSALLALGMIGEIASPTVFPDDWLIVLLKLNVVSSGVQPTALNALSLLDIGLMVLFGIVSLGLSLALRHASRTWAAIAAALPFLGIGVFLLTRTAGRSAVLLALLLLSIVMLRGDLFGKAAAWIGIMASGLLFFAGDLGTAFFAPLGIIAALIGIGYVLWMGWLVIVGWRLLQLGGAQPYGEAGLRNRNARRNGAV
jgi:hypothetical protein